MENLLHKSLQILRNLNVRVGSKAISENEFLEEEENIARFIQVKKEFLELLKQMEKESDADHKTINEQLIHLHLKFSKTIWHLEQMQELVRKMISAYIDVQVGWHPEWIKNRNSKDLCLLADLFEKITSENTEES